MRRSSPNAEDRDQESCGFVLEAKDHCQWLSLQISSFHPVLPITGANIRFRLLEDIPRLYHDVRIQDVKAFICQLLSEMLTRDQSSGRQAVTDKVRRFCPG
jgi:hypothetical protein